MAVSRIRKLEHENEVVGGHVIVPVMLVEQVLGRFDEIAADRLGSREKPLVSVVFPVATEVADERLDIVRGRRCTTHTIERRN